MTIFFTSDLHFNHYNIISYCNRPYKTVDEMNSSLIKNWNSVVKPNDIVYHLGDFCFCKKDFTMFNYFLHKLNGKKYFIQGNHDKKESFIGAKNEGLINIIPTGYSLKLDKYPITLTHYPFIEWPQCSHNGIQLFGHIHNSLSDKECQELWFNNTYHKSKYWYNVGIDNTNYIPISWQEIKNNIEKRVG